ncbi:MAG: hypothetical protein CSA18_03805 [Deltaproteobacteria bacterium]|nr:MAG: hypothetical protein CSA18_03805 [Deltaproteobacteria bacterium]
MRQSHNQIPGMINDSARDIDKKETDGLHLFVFHTRFQCQTFNDGVEIQVDYHYLLSLKGKSILVK